MKYLRQLSCILGALCCFVDAQSGFGMVAKRMACSHLPAAVFEQPHVQPSPPAWRLHAEFDKRYPRDNRVLTGTAIRDVSGLAGRCAVQDPYDPRAFNALLAHKGVHRAGTLCRGLIAPEDLDAYAGKVTVRVRLRLPQAGDPALVPPGMRVVNVRCVNTATGQVYAESAITTDAMKTGMDGVRVALHHDCDYGIVNIGTFLKQAHDKLDIRVEWHGEVNMYLDWIDIDGEDGR